MSGFWETVFSVILGVPVLLAYGATVFVSYRRNAGIFDRDPITAGVIALFAGAYFPLTWLIWFVKYRSGERILPA
jgi:undecaprenyl pyrophosphate phosphatase UppP